MRVSLTSVAFASGYEHVVLAEGDAGRGPLHGQAELHDAVAEDMDRRLLAGMAIDLVDEVTTAFLVRRIAPAGSAAEACVPGQGCSSRLHPARRGVDHAALGSPSSSTPS